MRDPDDVTLHAAPGSAIATDRPAAAVPTTSPILLSQADITEVEERYLLDAVRSGWVTPLGPHVDAFENELRARVGTAGAVALSSGTAALHLALLHLGAGPDSVVVLPSMTFAATANAVAYTGASPVFVDSRPDDGNVDPELLLAAVDRLTRSGRRVAAAITVDLFGRCADYAAIESRLLDRGVPLIEDAAEALGSTSAGRAAGSFGRVGVLSFNGNKIMTTSGGGMLLSDDADLLEHCRYLATQARQPEPHYEHTEIGFNYRLSNVLAALGRAQLSRLDTMIARRRRIHRRYRDGLSEIAGLRFLGDPDADPATRRFDNCWLTCVVLDPRIASISAGRLIRALAAAGIEARHLWKPMHLQPVFAGAQALTNGHAEHLFTHGVALPSGSALTDEQIDLVIRSVRAALAAR